MDILGQSALVLSVSAFAIAVTALSRNFRNKLVMAFALTCAIVSCWALSFFLEKIFVTGFFYRFHLTFNLLVAPVGLFFLRVLTRVDSAFLRWLYRISVSYALVFIGLEWSIWGDTQWVLVATYLGPIFLALVCLHFMFIDWRLKKGVVRKAKISTVGLTRRGWIYVGALFVLSAAVMDHVPLFGDVIPSLGNIFLCLYLFVISEAVIHQRLLNISALFNRLAVLVFISVCFTAIFTMLVGWIENSPALFLLNAFLASFLILLLSEPFQKLMNLGVARLFNRKYVKFERKTEDAQLQLTGVLDTVGLAQLTLGFLENVLPVESATVFILRSDGTKFRRVRGLRDEALINREILANHPIIDFFNRIRRRGETPVILDTYLENEIDRTTSEIQRQYYDTVIKGMQALNANIAVAFVDGATVLGFVVVRANTPPEPWGNNWGVLSVISPYFQQAARTLKNMDVYVRLREKDRLAALGEMAAGLAHEIRNPLGAIKGAAQYLEPQTAGPSGAFLSVIVEEVNRLNNVVTQFLDYSRPLAADFVEYDVGNIIERTVALFRSEQLGCGGGNCSIEMVPPASGFSEIPRLRCAPEQIKQVLVNLVQNGVNAIKENPIDRPGKIRVGAYTQRRNRDRALEAVLFVEDNGKGISREDIEKIFIPFYTTSPGGTGLGLSICSRIVEAHGGRFDVVSEEGKFARFEIHLPVSENREVVS